MADQTQTPRVGVVGQQNNQPQQAQQTPQQGVPGVQQPPVPSPEQVQKIMAAQQAEVQKQIQARRATLGYTNNQPNAQQDPQQQSRFTQQSPQQSPPQQVVQSQQAQQIPEQVAAQMPPQMRDQQVSQQQPPQQPVPSPVQGLTAEQVLAGPPQQQQPQPQQQYQPQPQYQQPQQQYQPQPQQQQYQQPQPQYQQPQYQQAPPQQPPQGGHIAAYSQPQEAAQEIVPWFPVRGSKGSVDIALTDVVIKNVPSKGMIGESDARAKVTLALFSEILALREKVNWLMNNQQQAPQLPPDLFQRIHRLEQTLFEQREALSSRARGVREQIEMAKMNGMSPEQILAQLQGQAVAAGQMAQGVAQMPAPSHISAGQQPQAQASMVGAATGAQPQAVAQPAQPAPQEESTESGQETQSD